jgi:hypothetical protein
MTTPHVSRLWTTLVLAAIFGAGAAPPAARAENSPRSAKDGLTPETFAKLHTLVRPHDHEWRHLRVHWLTDVVAVRKKAADEDKPIIICYTGGAGYNEPLGTC